MHDDGPLRRTGDHGKQIGLALQLLQGRIEIGGLIQRMRFALVGEQNIHHAVANQPEEFVAIAIDAKSVG